MDFKLKSEYKPTGDQPQAIDTLVKSIENGNKEQISGDIEDTGNRNGDRRHSGITDSAEKYCRPDYRRR